MDNGQIVIPVSVNNHATGERIAFKVFSAEYPLDAFGYAHRELLKGNEVILDPPRPYTSKMREYDYRDKQ